MKKLLCFLLAVVCLMSFCGCARLLEPAQELLSDLQEALNDLQEQLNDLQEFLEQPQLPWSPPDEEPLVTAPIWPPVALPTKPVFPEETETQTLPPTEPAETFPLHSEFYIPGLDVEDVILYFSEVCLDAEFSEGGDPGLLQKWDAPILYSLQGDYTEEDLAVMKEFMDWLNRLYGFPGIWEAEEAWQSNLQIHFCTADQMQELLGDHFVGMDGGVTFWYDGNNRIFDATICYRKDMQGPLRRSVILEEIYNGLGPVQDTSYRRDSLIYSGYSEPQNLTAIDELILKLLYHPDMKCGMDAAACENVIRKLYY